ncbi:hypothetical protein MTO96_023469, partial [Rhipicephalus appendiculatus]
MMDSFSLAVLVTTMLSALIYCQINHDELPKRDKDMLKYVREMLNDSKRLLLFVGVNGPMEDDRICWRSEEKVETYPTFHHYIYFMKNETKQPAKRLHQMERRTDYGVGPKQSVPSILLEAYDGGRKDPKLSGDYLILGARPTCFVMGVVGPSVSK